MICTFDEFEFRILFLICYIALMSILSSVLVYKITLNDFKYKNKPIPYRSMFIFSILGIILTQVAREVLVYKNAPDIARGMYSSLGFELNESFIISMMFTSVFAIIIMFSLLMIFFEDNKNFIIKHNKVLTTIICTIICIVCVWLLNIGSYLISRNVSPYPEPYIDLSPTWN